jgi:hypothetical protein
MDSLGQSAQLEMIEIFVLEVSGSHLGWDFDYEIKALRGFVQNLHVYQATDFSFFVFYMSSTLSSKDRARTQGL